METYFILASHFLLQLHVRMGVHLLSWLILHALLGHMHPQVGNLPLSIPHRAPQPGNFGAQPCCHTLLLLLSLLLHLLPGLCRRGVVGRASGCIRFELPHSLPQKGDRAKVFGSRSRAERLGTRVSRKSGGGGNVCRDSNSPQG